ncbi:hypothetical protein Tco_1002570 [Tanacetum coccineum]|uniref:Uncharacterized protein n=1 Tax=Tanacetum coccineum TaxID=301880 RepID=A0ABQ5F8H2_9ASTR
MSEDDRYDKIQRNELWLMCMFEDRNKERYAHVDWVIAKLMKRKGMVIQEGSIIICGQIVTKLVKKLQLLSNDVLDGLRDPNYCRSLDATTPRELIGPDGRLIVKDPSPGVPRQSYHSDRYASVFEYMVGHYEVSLDGYFGPPEYDEQ